MTRRHADAGRTFSIYRSSLFGAGRSLFGSVRRGSPTPPKRPTARSPLRIAHSAMNFGRENGKHAAPIRKLRSIERLMNAHLETAPLEGQEPGLRTNGWPGLERLRETPVWPNPHLQSMSTDFQPGLPVGPAPATLPGSLRTSCSSVILPIPGLNKCDHASRLERDR